MRVEQTLRVEQQKVGTNGIQLNVACAGPPDGPLVILLHGFPEFWYGWRHQIAFLAEAGLRIWAPDQRGYNLSDKPRGPAAYSLDILADDVLGLIDAAGEARAALVGHDWGAAVAWRLASQHPQRIERMVAINAPHPSIMGGYLRRNISQLRKSWYMAFFQLPWLPELLARQDNWRLAVGALEKTSRPGTFSPEDFAAYRHAWSQPGAYTAMVNWYRAAGRCQGRASAGQITRVPTLILWGARDHFLDRGLARRSLDRCAEGRLVYIEQASHWLQHEEPEQVNRLILNFLQPPDFADAGAGSS